MYFKIIYNALVIDILDSVQYVRWLKRGKKFVKTEMTSANGILASDGINIYHVEGMPDFNGMGNYKTVHMLQIEKEEYDKLKSQMVEGDVIYADQSAFSTEEKLKLEISNLKKQLAAVSSQSHQSTNDVAKNTHDLAKTVDELAAVKIENQELLKQLENVKAENVELADQLMAAKILLGVD